MRLGLAFAALVAVVLGMGMVGCSLELVEDRPVPNNGELISLPSTALPQVEAPAPLPAKEPAPPLQQQELPLSLTSSERPPVAEALQTEKPKLHILYLRQLDSFKDSPSFARYGFATGGPHHQWLAQVQAARKLDHLDMETGVGLGELIMLGLEYNRTDGAENEDTRWFRKRVLDPFGND